MSDPAPDRSQLTRGLIHLLDVEPTGTERQFIGHRRPGGVGRVFGGQVVGQAIMAAAKTVQKSRPIHSMHCYFMRPGSEDHAIDYRVEADMEGRSFSNRRVVAWQQNKPIFNMIASFHQPERGPAHQFLMLDVPAPDALLGMGELLTKYDFPAGPVLRRMARPTNPVEFRPVGAIQSGASADDREPFAQCWIRIGAGPLGVEQSLQRGLLGFVSDMLLLATAYRPHGLVIGGPDVISASIDHSIWFHDDVECGDWLLYAMDSPWAGQGRGFARGHFFTADGRLIASVAQEGLIRLRDPD